MQLLDLPLSDLVEGLLVGAATVESMAHEKQDVLLLPGEATSLQLLPQEPGGKASGHKERRITKRSGAETILRTFRDVHDIKRAVVQEKNTY